jgi:WD40 repeat protein
VARRHLGSSSHSRWNLVDLGAGKLLSSRALAMDVLAADSSPDGEKLAVTGVGGEMWLLDSRTGQPVSQPPVGDGADNIWVAYADDGAQVVTGAVDGTLGLWDGRTGRLLGTVGLPEKTPLAATFLYGGQDLLIASHAGGVYHWNSLVSEASTFACALAGRTLTRTEWREFTDRPYQPRCPKLPGLPPDLS